MSLIIWRFRFRKYVRTPLVRAGGAMLCCIGLHRTPANWAGDPICVRNGCHLARRTELPALSDECEHDVQPVDEHWGRCTRCGESGFPLTIEAAYGPVKCTACHDTGMVPAVIDGRLHVMADARCPACGGGE